MTDPTSIVIPTDDPPTLADFLSPELAQALTAEITEVTKNSLVSEITSLATPSEDSVPFTGFIEYEPEIIDIPVSIDRNNETRALLDAKGIHGLLYEETLEVGIDIDTVTYTPDGTEVESRETLWDISTPARMDEWALQGSDPSKRRTASMRVTQVMYHSITQPVSLDFDSRQAMLDWVHRGYTFEEQT